MKRVGGLKNTILYFMEGVNDRNVIKGNCEFLIEEGHKAWGMEHGEEISNCELRN
jgi:hypothetical protein